MSEGRSCPLAYRYRPQDLITSPVEVGEDVLYIIGGLYGNPFALDEIERMAAAERRDGRRVKLVFNGDFNWFNASDDLFRDINHRVMAHTASLGNVEYELGSPSDGAGCGCAYPESVDQQVVERSNRIMERLQQVAGNHPDVRAALAGLPRYRSLIFGGLNILVLHGDPESLAGWGLSRESLQPERDNAGTNRVADWLQTTGADVIACTHTCQPALWRGRVDGRPRVVVNNGSAGMGNLSGKPGGLITRIALSEPEAAPVAASGGSGLSVSLVPVDYDVSAWLACFDRVWPSGSPAALSYRERIVRGTSLVPDDLLIGSGL